MNSNNVKFYFYFKSKEETKILLLSSKIHENFVTLRVANVL